jgi:hypothetical protein
METKELIERNKKSIDELFVRISKSKIPIERFVIIEKFKDSAVGYTYTKLISTIKPLALNNDANGITMALTEYHNSLVARKTT